VEEDKEKGVWIVYDLKANREIQRLLIEKKFAFRFDPNLKVTINKDKKTAKQCLNYKNFHCHNKNCLSWICPLNENKLK